MKRLLLPLILVILFTAVVFVSCSKEDAAPTTEPETEVETSSTTTTTTAKPNIPTFKTAAPTSSTEFKGTPVIYSTTSTTTTTKATSTTKAPTTTTTALTTPTSTPTTTTNPGEKEFDEEDKEVGPVIPLDPGSNSTNSFTQMLINTLG